MITEKKKKANKKYYDSHKDKCFEVNKKWDMKHKDKLSGYMRKYNQKLRLLVIEKLGGKCSNPYSIDHLGFEKEEDYVICLQVDHINGGGNKEFKRIGKSAIYRKVLKDSTGYQLLCANCNWLKRFKNREW